MIVQLMDHVTGTAVYINPAYVVTVRPDPTEPDHLSEVKLEDGESVKVQGDHQQVADKLSRAEAAL